MTTLKELKLAAELKGIAPGRMIGEQVYDANINTVSQDTDLGSDTYSQSQTNMQDIDPFYAGLQSVTQPIGSMLNKYGVPIMAGIMGMATGIPGMSFIMNKFGSKPYDQNLLDMYGGYGPHGRKDKYGYNVVSMMDNYMQPGTSSYRSHALAGLRSLDQDLANQFYMDNYGLTYDDVKTQIQQKKDPFDSGGIMDMGADYQGDGNDNQSFNESPVGNNAGGAQLGSGMSTGQHAAFRE